MAWDKGKILGYGRKEKEMSSDGTSHMLKHSIAWYVERFGVMKVDFQTRRGRLDNELLVLWLTSGPRRVTYIAVYSGGVAVCGEGFSIYADWLKGDRFERMYEAMEWLALPCRLSPPQMAWSDQAVWEVEPPRSFE
jgi:hypothetical protein